MESSDTGEITIEVAKVADAEQIKDVQLATWLKTYPNKVAGITVDDIEARFADVSGERMVRRKRNLELPEPGTTTLVARKDGMVVGVCMTVKKTDRNQLQMIYVHPEYQRLGIGKKLWDEGRKFLDPAKDTYVDVVDYNQQAIDFYRKLGFVPTGHAHQDERFRMKSGSILTEMEMVLKVIMETKALELAKTFLGKEVEVTMDRPIGTKHPKFDFEYTENYGYIDGVDAPDGEFLDAFFLGAGKPLERAKGICIAIAHRKDDDDDKLIVVAKGVSMTDKEIMDTIWFQEQYFDTEIVR